ncbi:MAG: transcriptional regulator [Planctomycetaceae bacterium]|nr:transcriptional regulator [Planctomycetaceae bacterium]
MTPAARHESTPEAGQFAFEGLERVLHEKARLGILSSLVSNPEGLVFSELKELCNLTDGNLNRHLKALQEAHLIQVNKGRSGKRPQTLVLLTPEGRERFLDYINLLEQIVSQTLDAAESKKQKSLNPHRDAGWSPA